MKPFLLPLNIVFNSFKSNELYVTKKIDLGVLVNGALNHSA